MLKIPERTFQRYLHAVFEPERRVLEAQLTDDELLNQLAIMEARFTKDRRDIINAIKDPNMDPKRLTAIVNGYHLVDELGAGIFKIHADSAPAVLTRRHNYFLENRKKMIEKLELLKKKKKEEDEDVEEYLSDDDESIEDKEKEPRGEWDDFDEEEKDDDNYDGQERRES